MDDLQIRYNSLYNSPSVEQRAVAAIHKAATDVLAEDGGTANHSARVAWAHAALHSLDDLKAQWRRWAPTIFTNSTLAAEGEEATANDIQFVVNSLVDTFAAG